MIMVHAIWFIVAYFTLNIQAALGCPNGWETFERSCYFISDMREDWAAASSACRLYHAHLAEITSPFENNYIHQLIRKYHDGHRDVEYWLGGSDGSKEGEWTWVDSGLPMNYTDWYPGEPNDLHHGQDCVQFRVHYHTYHWDDDECSEKRPFVCEIADVVASVGIIGRK